MNKSLVYEGWLNTLVNSATSGGLLWQLVYEGWRDVDGYSISCSGPAFSRTLVCDVLATSGLLIHERDLGVLRPPMNSFLYPNFPNPFNEVTVIRYDLGSESRVQLEVFNELGQKVAALFDGWQPPGRYASLFEGKGLASGVYFYNLRAGELAETKKMLYLK